MTGRVSRGVRSSTLDDLQAGPHVALARARAAQIVLGRRRALDLAASLPGDERRVVEALVEHLDAVLVDGAES